MKRLINISLILTLTLLTSLPIYGAEVTLPSSVKAKPGRLLKIEAKSEDATSYYWVACGDADVIQSDSGKWVIFSALTPGEYKVVVVVADKAGKQNAAACLVTVEGVVPPTPIPPIPTPTPTPVPPTEPLDRLI